MFFNSSIIEKISLDAFLGAWFSSVGGAKPEGRGFEPHRENSGRGDVNPKVVMGGATKKGRDIQLEGEKRGRVQTRKSFSEREIITVGGANMEAWLSAFSFSFSFPCGEMKRRF